MSTQILFHSVWTVVLMVLFVGIAAWAWGGRRKRSFDAAARLPLEDEDDTVAPTPEAEKKHG
jgi:cytochrome c oxidase cbb3-type subunit 4